MNGDKMEVDIEYLIKQDRDREDQRLRLYGRARRIAHVNCRLKSPIKEKYGWFKVRYKCPYCRKELFCDDWLFWEGNTPDLHYVKCECGYEYAWE